MSLLAHDMRNPLAALSTNINFIRSVMKNRVTDVDEALSDCAVSCTLLGHIIGNLDVFSRAFADTPPVRQALPLQKTSGDALARWAEHARTSGIELELSADERKSAVLVDPYLFSRALDNLLANALQHSRGKVMLECTARGDRGYLIVTDSGPAVPDDLRDFVMTAGGQNAAKFKYEARYGSGLGLYCAAEAARAAGAEVALGERSGGSMFELSAPLAP